MESEGATPEGSIWIVRVADRESIFRLIEGDPMYRANLRTYQILATGKRFDVQDET